MKIYYVVLEKKQGSQICAHYYLRKGPLKGPLNSFGAIGDYSRPLVDRYCRLWST